MSVDIALALAGMGFKVFPLFPGRKHPALPEWPKLATTDEAQIREWWSGNVQVKNKKGKTWAIPSNANVGIHTTDMCVLDVDMKDGTATGLTSLDTLTPAPTLMSKTPTGGLHLLFQMPGGVQVGNRAGWLPNIDIRGDCGYIVAAGSVINGVAYEWINPGVPIAMVPPAILESVGAKSAAPVTNNLGPEKPDYTVLPAVVPVGTRDQVVFAYCCFWRSQNVSEEQAKTNLEALFACIHQPPDDLFTWETACAKLEQAWQYPAGGTPPVVPAAGAVYDPLNPFPTLIDLPGMLQRNVFIELDSKVGDMVTATTLTLKSFKESMLPNFYIEPARGNGAGRVVRIADQWMASQHRKTAHDIAYFPKAGLPIIKNWREDPCFNTFKPTTLPYIETPDMNILKPFMNHMGFLVPTKKALEVAYNWIACNVQKPWIKPYALLFITPGVGLGKNLLFEMFRKILGKSNVKRVSEEMLKDSNQFNDFMVDVSMLLWDEVKVKTLGYNKLKTWISDSLQQINRKYGRLRQEMTYNSNIMFSNHLDAIQIEDPDDRRIYVTDCREMRQSPAYYSKMFKLIEEDDLVAAHFLALMRQRDISKFDPYNPPMTPEKRAMMVSSKSDAQVMVDDYIEAERGPCMFDIITPGLLHFVLRIEDGAFKSVRALGRYLSSITARNKLPTAEFVVPTKGGPVELNVVRPRNLICLRNYDKWKKADTAEIRLEFLRAREAAKHLNFNENAIIKEVQQWALKEV